MKFYLKHFPLTIFLFSTLLLLGWLSGKTFLLAQTKEIVEITLEKHVLPNGLTVILHEDHKAPIVAFNVWYYVGYKNEKTRQNRFYSSF